MLKKGEIVVKQSLSQQVYERLLEQILKNELVPGELINRREVAAQLGVSVAPTLEAMLQLESEGLLETFPRKGTRVRIITDEDLRGQVILRQALECQAARFYHGRLIIDNEARLLKLAEKVDVSEVGTRDNWQNEIEFHRSLMELAPFPILVREFNKVMRLSLFFAANKLSTLNFNDRYERVVNRHANLIEKLKTDDPDEAERLLREHLYSSRLLSKFNQNTYHA
jgi:DNA-binding GntR family transcriptional regulator